MLMNKYHILKETSPKRNTNEPRVHFFLLHFFCVFVMHNYVVIHACLHAYRAQRSVAGVFANHFMLEHFKAESLTEPGTHGFIGLSGQ